VVYGGVNYRTGQITYTVAQTKSGQNFLLFLTVLVAAYAGRKVRLVCDNARFHKTQAVRHWLDMNQDRIEIFWLPPYCPSLNLIERLWGHLRRTVLANDIDLSDVMHAKLLVEMQNAVGGRRIAGGLVIGQALRGVPEAE
jgi:transposase